MSFEEQGEEASVGLRFVIVETMKWEEQRARWIRGNDQRQVRVKKVEEFDSGMKNGWRRFGCYIFG